MKIIILSMIISINSFSDEIVKKECGKLSSSLTGNKVHCVGISTEIDGVSQLQGLTSVSEPLQEWLWMSDKIKKTMIENSKKMKALNLTENSFLMAKAGFPNKEKDYEHSLKVDQYKAKYEDLYQATFDESMLYDAIQTCQKPTLGGIRMCSLEKMDELKLRYAGAQSKKLSILMSYPLLSNEKVRENIESDIDMQKRFLNGEMRDQYGDYHDFKNQQMIKRRESLTDIMIEGIDKTRVALKERQAKWAKLYEQNNKSAINEIEFKNGNRKKSPWEKYVDKYSSQVEEFQEDNTEYITELIAGSNIDEEMKNPYIGKAICSIYNRNLEQIEVDKRNQIILDTSLMVAPFLLGPIGLAARLATMGRFANWGVKGRIALAGSVEGGLLAKDLSDIQKTQDKCNGLKIRLLNSEEQARKLLPKNSPEFSKGAANIQQMEACEKELETQILVGAAGVALGPIAFVYGKGIRSMSKLPKDAKAVLSKFGKGRESNQLKKFLRTEDLSPGDMKAIQKDFQQFKKEKGLRGEELVAAYKKRYQERFGPPVCSI